MAGGQTILTGFGILLALLIWLVSWQHDGHLLVLSSVWTLIKGGVPLLCFLVGLVLCWIGWNDRKATETERKQQPAGGGQG